MIPPYCRTDRSTAPTRRGQLNCDHGRKRLILTDEQTAPVPGVPVEVVDTTGAGDAFNAGLAVALTEGRDLVEAIQYANCAGAIACIRLGVTPALGYRAGG